jgi:hypothetical protein
MAVPADRQLLKTHYPQEKAEELTGRETSSLVHDFRSVKVGDKRYFLKSAVDAVARKKEAARRDFSRALKRNFTLEEVCKLTGLSDTHIYNLKKPRIRRVKATHPEHGMQVALFNKADVRKFAKSIAVPEGWLHYGEAERRFGISIDKLRDLARDKLVRTTEYPARGGEKKALHAHERELEGMYGRHVGAGPVLDAAKRYMENLNKRSLEAETGGYSYGSVQEAITQLQRERLALDRKDPDGLDGEASRQKSQATQLISVLEDLAHKKKPFDSNREDWGRRPG